MMDTSDFKCVIAITKTAPTNTNTVIIGSPFMKAYMTVFDSVNQKVGFGLTMNSLGYIIKN